MANKKAISKANLELALTENNKRIKQYTDTKVNDKVPFTRTINGKALSSDITLSASDVGADPSGTASSNIASHNTSTQAHNDMRVLITELTTRLNALADSDDTTLDQLSELVAYIKDNRELIESITTNKVNVSDIVDNLTTNISNKVLSAAQGVVLKTLIDALISGTTQVGNAKTLDGHDSDYFATEQSVTDILDGITPAGDSNKLGGKEASEYVTYEFETINTSVLEKALSLPAPSMRVYKLNGDSYTGGDLPSEATYMYSDAICIKHGGNTAIVILTGYGKGAKRLAINYYAEGAWQGWETNATTADLENYLPIINGTAKMSSLGGMVIERTSDTVCAPRYVGNGNALGYLGFSGVDIPAVYAADGATSYRLLHTGNKPTGTYTGNGSAEARMIKIGGIGKILHVYSSTVGRSVIVAPYGAIAITSAGEVIGFRTSQVRFLDGYLYIYTDDSTINQNGVTYGYDLL